MSTELIVPTLGESITDATVSKWLKDIGDEFEVDEPLVEIETEKITVEVSAPKAGKLSEIKVKEGQDIKIGGVLGIINDMDTGNKEKKKNSVNKNKDNRQSKETENKARATNNNLKNKKTSPSVRKIFRRKLKF